MLLECAPGRTNSIFQRSTQQTNLRFTGEWKIHTHTRVHFLSGKQTPVNRLSSCLRNGSGTVCSRESVNLSGLVTRDDWVYDTNTLSNWLFIYYLLRIKYISLFVTFHRNFQTNFKTPPISPPKRISLKTRTKLSKDSEFQYHRCSS